nr:protein ALP1-like isoform X2 [Pelodiscus sinensis]|eukprot:XP_006137619.1 protein ALP1-like isoform X2 [Pelodiscus sinensis]
MRGGEGHQHHGSSTWATSTPSLLNLPVCFFNCGGAVVGTHIPIWALDHRASFYINWKGYFSMVLHALIDHRSQFTNIYIGWSGKAHDTHVFRNSSIFQKQYAGTFFPNCTIKVEDVDMPMFIVGDAAYPQMLWLMKPYTRHLDPIRECFNARHSGACMVVEGIFGHLKVRFHCLRTQLDVGKRNIPQVMAACCVLHNIC